MGTNAHQHLFVYVFRPGRIEMLSIHTDFAITIRFQPFIPADIEPFWRPHQEGFPVLFKQFPDRDLFFIMEFGSFLFMAGKQLLVILLYLIAMRDRDKQVRTVIINLALHIPFFPAGIGVAAVSYTHLVEEVAAELGVSKSYAYKIVKQLNDELQKLGYLTVSGRVRCV